MAASTSSLTERLNKLEQASVRAAKLKRGTRLSAGPMAEVLGVRWPALRDWCDEIGELESKGAVVRGGNGMEWAFDPQRTVKILISHFRSRVEGQARKSRALTKAIGVNMSPQEAAPSFAETKDLVNLTLTVVAAAEKTGQYTRTEEVADFLEGYNVAAVSGVMGVLTEVDPNGNLPPQVRKDVDHYLRLVAVNMRRRAEQYVELKRAGLQQRRAS